MAIVHRMLRPVAILDHARSFGNDTDAQLS